MNSFKEGYRLPQNYLDAIEKRRKQIESELKQIEEEFLEKNNRPMTEEERNRVKKLLAEKYSRISVKITPEEKETLEKSISRPEKDEQKKILMQFIKEQAKGFFIILELIKQQIELLIENELISKENVKILARIKGLESSLTNEEINKGRMEGKLKALDDIFGITIIANNKKDILTIKKQLSNYLIKVIKSKPINKTTKDENGNQIGYSATHDIGYLNPKVFEWIDKVDVKEYKEQIKECIGEETDSVITQEEIEEIYNKKYESEEELPEIEIHYQSNEEYIRTNSTAPHVKYKQENGQENAIDIMQKYIYGEFHRFVDIPLMFQWVPGDKRIELLEREKTLFIIHPYLKTFEGPKQSKEH